MISGSDKLRNYDSDFSLSTSAAWKTEGLLRDPYIIHLNIATSKWRFPFLFFGVEKATS